MFVLHTDEVRYGTQDIMSAQTSRIRSQSTRPLFGGWSSHLVPLSPLSIYSFRHLVAFPTFPC